jgi:parallel beta-helix repeat protein
MKTAIVIVAVLSIPALAFSATIYVPDDYPTIQGAIDAAVDGDAVIVRAGTYVENINFGDNAITLKSEKGPHVTIIDGNDSGNVVVIHDITAKGKYLVVLDGFTIQNGYAKSSAYSIHGGGIYCHYSHAENPYRILNNIIIDNEAEGRGGGIFCGAAPHTIIKNNIIANNRAEGNGGGIYCGESYPEIINNTITNNDTEMSGGGIHSDLSISDPTITNTILWCNTAKLKGNEIYVSNSAKLSIDYSDVKSGMYSVHVDPSSTLYWGPGMIDADPLFVVGPHGFYYLSQIAAGQSTDSPCVNSGSDLASNLGMDTLWTRTNSVPDSGVVDMGFHYGPFSAGYTVPLYSDTYIIPETVGGSANFTLTAGVENANRNYLIVGGVSGTEPGTQLPGGFATLPVNWDWFSDLEMLLLGTPIFLDFMGTLDAQGQGGAQLNVPPLPSGSAGLIMHYAYCCNNPLDFVSNPVAIEIVP